MDGENVNDELNEMYRGLVEVRMLGWSSRVRTLHAVHL